LMVNWCIYVGRARARLYSSYVLSVRDYSGGRGGRAARRSPRGFSADRLQIRVFVGFGI
jgi:hypothetical protein